MARFRVQVANSLAQVYERYVIHCAEEGKDINSLKDFMWFCASVVDADVQKADAEKLVCKCPVGGIHKLCPVHGVSS